MPVHISRSLLRCITAFAEESPALEVCGLLLGQGRVISDIRPAANVAVDPERRFEIDPAILLRTYRESRENAYDVLGHYHSHPGGRSEPSPTDAVEAIEDGILWLIVGDDGAQLWQTGAGGLHGRFHLQQLVVEPH